MGNPPSVLSHASPDGTGTHPQAGLSEGVRQAIEKVKQAFKVVDAKGKPLVVYHGTTKDITEGAEAKGLTKAEIELS